MPFIKPEKRKIIDNLEDYTKIFFDEHHFDFQVGDICYCFYKQMVDLWKKTPRWYTAHQIYLQKEMVVKNKNYSEDARAAVELAWQVFFQKYVIPYENQKEKENGGI